MTRSISRRKAEDVTEPVEDTEEKKTTGRNIGKRRNTEEDEESVMPDAVGEGWDAYDQQASESSGFADKFKLPVGKANEVIIHFVDPGPFAVFNQHWIEREGKKSWTCLKTKTNPSCPICDRIPSKLSNQSMFNIVDFSDPENPLLKVWQVGKGYGDVIKSFSSVAKTRPLNREDLYFSVSRSDNKTGAKTLSMSDIKARDLEEDWGVTALTSEEIAEFEDNKYDKSIAPTNTPKQLKEIADEQLDGDD
jgi:hypothetical protein